MADATQHSTSRLFAAVREAQDQSLRLGDANEHSRARARLLQAVDQAQLDARPASATPSGGRSSSAPWRWGLGTLAAAACALAVVFAWPGDDALEFSVDGVEVAANELIVAGEYTRTLSFSDSTKIELSPGSRMYVEELRDNGASVVLEHGEVALSVHHEFDTSWQVAAGPYSVHVTGTQFSVAWEPSSEHFEVEVREGSVRVEGIEGEIASLRAGESFVEERGKATIEPETLEAQPSQSDPEVVAQADTSALVEDGGEEPLGQDAGEVAIADKPDKPKPSKSPTWLEYFDDADYPAAWQALSELPGGIHGEAKGAKAPTLLDLADVARFTKHRDDARKLLAQLRDRFPGSDEASEAAFTLGRLAADGGSQAEAATYFELYLDELPNGSLAGDALARLMDSYVSLGRDAKAESAAERYLARFPKGPHAAKAHKIIDG